MNRNIIHKSLVAIFILFVLFSPAYSYKKIKVFVLKPPAQLFPGVKRIAVLDFEGQGEYGKQFSDFLVTHLIDNDRGIHPIATGFLGMGGKKEGKTLQEGTFTNVFDVIERSRLEQVIQEQQLTMSGLLDQSQAVSLGRLLGVDAIVMGKVTYSSQEQNFTETRTYKNKGQKFTKKVPCKKRTASVTVSLRVVGTESGEILGSTQATKSAEAKKCESAIAELPTVTEMVIGLMRKLSVDIANYLTPHYELVSYELEKIKTKPFDKIAEKAAKAAENLDVDKAYMIYKSIYDKDPYNPKVLYNLGVVNEVVGNFQQALEYYQMAYQLRDEGKYEKAIQRVNKNLEFTNALKQIGIEIQPHVFQTSIAQMTDITAKRVEIKGKREERVNVYAEPREGSEVVARVPGGVIFPVLGREGQWIKIKLLGGKEGYIQASKVKPK